MSDYNEFSRQFTKKTIFFWQCQFIEVENARNFKYGHGHSMPNNRAKKWYLMYEYEACNFHISARRVQMSDGNYDWNTAKRVRFLQGIANLTKRLSALSSSIGEQTTSTQEFCWVLFSWFCCLLFAIAFVVFTFWTLIPSAWLKLAGRLCMWEPRGFLYDFTALENRQSNFKL